jgi:molybdopterin-binding protein
MAELRPGRVAEILGVSVDTVRRLADDGALVTVRTEGGQRLIDGASVARFLTDRRPDPDGRAQSARNRFPGIVTRIERDGLAAIVEIRAGGHRIVSMITREAADELALEVGSPATAVVKATNVIVEGDR